MHFHGRTSDVALTVPRVYANHSQGYTQASLIDRATGSVHTGLSMNVLAPSGTIAPHLHSFEEGFYIIEGEAVLSAAAIAPGAWVPAISALSKSARFTPGATRANEPVRWLQIAAPQPKPEGAERDTFFPKQEKIDFTGEPLLGHFDASQIPEPGPARDALARSERRISEMAQR